MAFSCGKYMDFLFERTPNFDEDILKDWFPTDDAWTGQTLAGTWDAFTGDQHTYDRVHVAFPDMSGCWEEVDNTACLESPLPCAPSETCIGWGSTRKTYGKERKSYVTNPLCFDQIDSKAKAKQQFAAIISGLKDVTKMVNANWTRTWALRGAETLHICGSAGNSLAITDAVFGPDTSCNQINLGSADNLPTSRLTVQYLDTFYEPLQFEGYFKSKYMPSGMFKLITDPITARDLREQNPALTSNFRFTDFSIGGQMFKFGISTAVGNYAIAFDGFPARFEHLGNGVLQRVYPFTNAAATIGIKPEVASNYITAPYQIDFIWHTEALRVLTAKLQAVHPEMPFLVRDLAGKWKFTGPETDVLVFTDPTSGTTCTVDNKRRNQGLWWCDFERAARYERPELVRAILALREPGCVVDHPRCSSEPAYVVQDYASCNEMCQD